MTALRILPALLVLLGGCACTPAPRSRLPLTDQQRILATDFVSRLHYQFNHNDCGSIYSERAQNFGLQPERNWLNDCANLRIGLGTWQTVVIQAINYCGFAVCADGFAAFGKTTEHITVNLTLDSGQAKLSWFAIEDKGQTQIFPGSPGPFADPPSAHRQGPA